MVDRGSSRDGRPDRDSRAQLLLVGAIAIGLVLLGLVVVFNTVLFTEATTPTETLEDADEAEALNQQVRNDTRRIMIAVNNSRLVSSCSSSNLCAQIEQNITRYSTGLTASKAQTGPVFVNVIVEGVSDTGLNGVGTVSSCTLSLCANITVVYETEQFSWRRTQIVEVDV